MSEEIFDIIKEVVHEFLPNSRIILFGSRARSDFHSDSDFDLMVISDAHFVSSEKLILRTKIRVELLKRGIRSDVLLNNNDEIISKSKLSGHIVKTIMKEGIPL